MCTTRGILQTLCARGELDKALEFLAGLHKPLSSPIYVSLLKACCTYKALPAVKRLQVHLSHHRVPLAGPLVDHLVLALARCGALEEAHLVSDALSVFSWTALISAHADRGHPSESLRLHKCMLENHAVPNNYTYVTLFKACGSIPDLTSGMQLHADALKKGLGSDVFACNTLISMYGKCDATMEARCIFETMPDRTLVSWNAMLAALIEQGQGEETLRAFVQMHCEDVSADQATYVVTIQACALLAEKVGFVIWEGLTSKDVLMEIGQALHVDTRRIGVASDAFVGSTLISMYSKCGAIVEAEHVFGALALPNIVSWNTILSAYVEEDQGEKALQLYVHLQDSAIVPDQTTFVAVLQACAALADKEDDTKSSKQMFLQMGQSLHADAIRKGFTSVIFVGNTLVTMYGKCMAIAEAEHVFSSSKRTIMSWNAMLSVYIEQSQARNALLLYRQMQEESVSDERTLVMVLLACAIHADNDEAPLLEGMSSEMMSLEIGQALHADACKSGFFSDAFVGCALISMYGMCGDVGGADHVFDAMLDHDLPTWNAMISACVEQNGMEKSLLLYRQMQEEGVIPNQRTFVVVLQACAALAEKEGVLTTDRLPTKVIALSIGQALHADARRNGLTSDVFVGNTLIGMYGKCGAIREAEEVFGAFLQRDIVSWNALVSAYVDHGQEEEALRLYGQMQKHVVTHVTLTRMLQACSATGSLEYCRQLHFEVVSAGYDQNPSIAATVISSYGGCSCMVDSEAVFHGVLEPDLTTWNACIAGHAGDGNFLLGFHMYENLILVDKEVDAVTFIKIISACARTGLVIEGLQYFESMGSDHGICPDMKHYGCMLDLLGRTGDFKRIERFLERVPMQGDATFWLGLLGACTRGNVELAERAFLNAVNLQPEQSTAYVLMSNIYADAGLEKCAVELERARY